jgi:hypothetical protein
MSGTDLVISAEMKSFADNSAKGPKLWVIPKAQVYMYRFRIVPPRIT